MINSTAEGGKSTLLVCLDHQGRFDRFQFQNKDFSTREIFTLQRKMKTVISIGIGLLAMSVLTILLVFYYLLRKSREREDPNASFSSTNLPNLTLIKHIGRGGHGDVWLAKYKNSEVAVKSFATKGAKSCSREKEILRVLNTVKHENILRFIKAGAFNSESVHGSILITEYHSRGSLFDYLQDKMLDHQQLLKICESALFGIEYLHAQLVGKPSIAHRDLKPKNILMKKNGESVIADFGSAILFWKGRVVMSTSGTTKRYIAPELLEQQHILAPFQTFLMADMYSVGLTLWEISNRCALRSQLKSMKPYVRPYQHFTPAVPTCQDMYYVTKTLKLRPSIPHQWTIDPILYSLSKIMIQCWHEEPSERETASSARQKVSQLRKNNNIESNIDIV